MRAVNRLYWGVLSVLVACCVPDGDERGDVGRTARALVGVPQNGYPNYNERLMLVAMNRVRSEPNNVTLQTKAACSTDYQARPPLVPSYNGSRAARFHCQNLLLNRGNLSHNSFCTLRSDIAATSCDGAQACACVAGTAAFSCQGSGAGTNPFTRTGYFSFPAGGEIGAAGYPNAWEGVWGWVSECAGADGHRVAVTSGNYGQAGVGWAAGSNGCWSSFGFSDLASGGGAPPVLAGGVHRPELGGATTSFSFYVNYYDPGGAPASVDVVIDGVCFPMAKETGLGPSNATYLASQVVGAGCHEYWFLAKDSTSARRVWPEVGSYEVGSCSAYRSSSTPASCEGCVAGAVCAAQGGCQMGSTSCSGGQATCASLTNQPDGTSCVSGGKCVGGVCVAVLPDGGLADGGVPGDGGGGTGPGDGGSPTAPDGHGAADDPAGGPSSSQSVSGCSCRAAGEAAPLHVWTLALWASSAFRRRRPTSQG